MNVSLSEYSNIAGDFKKKDIKYQMPQISAVLHLCLLHILFLSFILALNNEKNLDLNYYTFFCANNLLCSPTQTAAK